MKKKILLFLCLFISFGASVFAASLKKGDTVYVSVKTVDLKDGNGGFAKDVTKLAYGDQLKILAVSGKKIQVQMQGGSKSKGWIPSNSVTTKKIVKSASGSTVSASTKELALAGKGFSEETEDVYKASHEKLDFSLVDAVESITVSESDLEAFIKNGDLKGATK